MHKLTLVLIVAVCCARMVAAQTVQFNDEKFTFEQARPANGYWVGHVTVKGTAHFAAIEVTEAHGTVDAEAMMLVIGAVNTAVTNVKTAGNELSFTLQAMGPRMTFAGTISEDGQRLTGAFTELNVDAPGEDEHQAEFARSIRPMKLSTAKAFTGKLVIPGMGSLDLTIVLAKTPGGNWVGHADVPAQGMLGLPLINISHTDGTINATMPIPRFPATIEGRIDEESKQFTGRFKQASYDLELSLSRNASYVSATLKRPQHPKPPFPYQTRDLRIPVPAGFELAGTLTLPSADAAAPPYPLAILISGSGQQDRDETLLGHKPFLVLADHLTRNGFAVFRYDDRGVGESGGLDGVNKATSKDFAEDVGAIVVHFKSHADIDPTRIGLIGHSEGGLIAPMVASERDDIAFIVMLAGTGVTGREILELQGRKIMEAEGIDAQHIEEFSNAQQRLLGLVANDANEEQIRAAATELQQQALKKQQAADATQLDPEQSPESPEVDAQVAMLTLPWMKFFLSHDPRPALAKLRCPVLAVNGTLDMQVWHDQNLPEIEKAITSGGGDVTIKRYDNLNHLFQPATTGGMSEYAAIETTFDKNVMRDIVAWLKSKVSTGAATP